MHLGDENIESDMCQRLSAALREHISMLEKHVVYSHKFLDGVLAARGMSNNWPQRDFETCFMEGDHGALFFYLSFGVYLLLFVLVLISLLFTCRYWTYWISYNC